jgi:hypothetical protein
VKAYVAMSKGLARDLSTEAPSGKHHFRGFLRIPFLGWQIRLVSQSPDRAPALVAARVVLWVCCALACPAALAAVTVTGLIQPPPWTILATACGFAIVLIGETKLVLLYERRQPRLRNQDLTKTEGVPTDRAYLLIEELETHEMVTREGAPIFVAVNWTSPWSLPGLGATVLILAVATLVPAAAFTGLAMRIHQATAEAIVAEILAVITSAVCGVAMMIRVEELERGPTCPGYWPWKQLRVGQAQGPGRKLRAAPRARELRSYRAKPPGGLAADTRVLGRARHRRYSAPGGPGTGGGDPQIALAPSVPADHFPPCLLTTQCLHGSCRPLAHKRR